MVKKFRCKKGCSECCGPVPMKKELLEKYKDLQQVEITELLEEGDSVIPITKDYKCVFLDRETNKCLIYAERPQICQDFGLKGNLDYPKGLMLCCPYFRPSGHKWSPKEKTLIKRRTELVFNQIKEKTDSN